MKNFMTITRVVLGALVLSLGSLSAKDNYPRTVFVPRQFSYNAFLESSLRNSPALDGTNNYQFHCSAKPIYSQNVGSKLRKYFSVNHQESMNVQENGSGDIDSLWFQVISPANTSYASALSFKPTWQTLGSLLSGEWKMPYNTVLSFNTAVLRTQTSMHISEANNANQGTISYLRTIADSFNNVNRTYGRIENTHVDVVGVDDIQLKLSKTVLNDNQNCLNLYGLLGIPTGSGSKAYNALEPLVGSKHWQIGLGSDYCRELFSNDSGSLALHSDLRWRYGFAAQERRLFDLTANGQWSRHLLLVNESDKYTNSFATNKLALLAQVTPRSSLDFSCALHFNKSNFNYEVGYNLWYRSSEKAALKNSSQFAANNGIADLVGIISLNPQSAGTATIAQSVVAGQYQMTSDTAFTPITLNNLNLRSGAAAASLSQTIYASVGFVTHDLTTPVHCGLSLAYEMGRDVQTPDAFYVWATAGISF